jgi:putative DNA primase/helicase
MPSLRFILRGDNIQAMPNPTTPSLALVKPVEKTTEYHHEAPPDVDLLPYNYTDTGNAERLIAAYGRDLLYCPEYKAWMIWNGSRWQQDADGAVHRMLVRTLRAFHGQIPEIPNAETRKTAAQHATLSEGAGRRRAALECASTIDGVCVSASQFDTDNWLFNCTNGTIDLRAERPLFREARRDDLITKSSPVAFDYSAVCPRFDKFLNSIFKGSAALIDYAQRVFGYTMTGDVSEKAIFCVFGDGNNGKTTLLETMRYVMGDYAGQIMIDSLLYREGGRDLTTNADIVGLKGLRMATTTETQRTSRLSEATIKQLTGMGQVKARGLNANPITFMPTHKILMDANHRPSVDSEDKSIWSQLKAVPCNARIPASEKDVGLRDKLRAEASGILAWAVIGCWLWRLHRLYAPPEIVSATADWQCENDNLRGFFLACCEFGPGLWTSSVVLEAEFDAWRESERSDATIPQMRKRIQMKGCIQSTKLENAVQIRGWKSISVSKFNP